MKSRCPFGIALSLLVCGPALRAAELPAPSCLDPVVRIDSAGALLCPPRLHWFSTDQPGPSHSVRFTFGVPPHPPVRQWPESEGLPICRTTWEHDGIRYTQSVLLTRLAAGDLMPEGSLPADSVLMIELAGENTNSDYTEARAAFACHAGDRTLELHWRDALVYSGGSTALLALVDLPSGGLANERGSELRFAGSMPPATTGAMTIKIPLAPLTGDAALNDLQDLVFDEQARRVKKFWAAAVSTAAPPPAPLAFVSPKP